MTDHTFEGQNILWLYGLSGADKSTLSTTVAEYFRELGRLKALSSLSSMHWMKTWKLPSAFRFSITSRAESDITDILDVQPSVAQKELSITTDSNTEDIHMFLRNEMGTIRQCYKMYDLASDWPGGSVLRDLVRRSTGLFI
ncbi:hypothetical protein PILCRDRAFT_7452 [Piloderma croceum F 1598]|uniref:Uncharacterized protein n=1 Tax=Piloderma croceum (strain F 1598) TaxID=765440 RepID=A0A0C3FWU9_PILCF|nr:hypothetical protein PILCRDRAFT_7452 [Piloderma croceum F 1598]